MLDDCHPVPQPCSLRLATIPISCYPTEVHKSIYVYLCLFLYFSLVGRHHHYCYESCFVSFTVLSQRSFYIYSDSSTHDYMVFACIERARFI